MKGRSACRACWLVRRWKGPAAASCVTNLCKLHRTRRGVGFGGNAWALLVLAWLVLPFATLPSRGQIPLTWHFDYTDFVVNPTDQIIVPATITNTSDAPFRISGDSKSFTGHLQYTYDWHWGSSLYDVTVPAHGTFQFLFGTLTPIGGSAPVGVYDAGPASISFGAGWQSSENTFRITVVPEPTTFTLLVLSSLALMTVRRPK